MKVERGSFRGFDAIYEVVAVSKHGHEYHKHHKIRNTES